MGLSDCFKIRAKPTPKNNASTGESNARAMKIKGMPIKIDFMYVL